MCRTFCIDPVPKVEKTYALLTTLHEKCLKAMAPGRELKGVVERAHAFLQKQAPELVGCLPKTLGFSVGLDYREAALVLNAKNTLLFEPGMVFNLSVGLQKVPLSDADKKDALGTVKKLDDFALLLCDTVLITEGEPEVLTKHPKAWDDVSYYINEKNDEDDDMDDDDDDEGAKAKGKKEVEKSIAGRGTVLESRLRERKTDENEAERAALGQKQADLMEKKIEARRRAAAGGGAAADAGDDGEEAVDVVAYRSPTQYPSELLANEIFVDMGAETVIVPIMGAPTPYHISLIKNAVKPDDDAKSAYMRLNFFTPSQSYGREVSANVKRLLDERADSACFVKELLFRSLDKRKLDQAYRLILELRKRFRARQLKEAEEADLVEQASLIKMRDQRIPKLSDLTMRPQLSGKKSSGMLEAHQNGLRFTSKKGELIDVMYANIKNALFQPCEKEVSVIIHFHLKNPIMVGKKKSKDVQFLTEVIDASEALDSSRRSVYDPDELDEEQRERRLRKTLNEAFKNFCKNLERVAKHFGANMEFDIPYRDLGWHGVPHREMVFIQPTVNCLVNLTEMPFFIIEIEAIEHVHLERCTSDRKNFDMVIVLKNARSHELEDAVANITGVPMAQLDTIQEWLTDLGITFTAGTMNLNWKTIMPTIKEDPFFWEEVDENGEHKPAGWHFLDLDSGDEDDDEENEDDNYEAPDSEDDDDDDDDDEDEDDEDDYSDEDDDDDDEEEEEDEGQSWEELEAEARAADRIRDTEPDEDARPKKKGKR